MPQRPTPQITQADLEAAWQRRRRADWPADLESVLANPMLSRLVHMEARRLLIARTQRAHADRAPRPATAPPRPAATPVQPLPARLDRKRLAAGESLDD